MAQTNPDDCQPKQVRLTTCDLLHQVWRDLYGKEVQQAATYSYLWLADQMGHIGLGILLLFAVSWLFELVGWGTPPDTYWPLLIAAAILCYWEISAYRTYAGRATGRFKPDLVLLARNAMVAAAYLIFGAVAAFSWHASAWWALGITVALIVASVALAGFWIRQKVVWQKAGLPFLARLADFPQTISSPSANMLQNLLDREIASRLGGKPIYPGPVVIITGPLRSGKTTLACSIGTECAFKGLKARYMTFDKLAQSSASNHDDTGPENINYWPWTDSEALIIDDIDDAGIQHRKGAEYLKVGEFTQIIEFDIGDYKQCLPRRMSVWVLGEKDEQELPGWIAAIIAYCTPTDQVTGQALPPETCVVKLGPSLTPPSPPGGDSKPSFCGRTAMTIRQWRQRISKGVGWAVIGLSGVVLLVAIGWLGAERAWDAPANLTPEAAFTHGTIGLEFAPYKLVAVFDQMAGDAMARGASASAPHDGGGPWWRAYGFIEKGGPTPPAPGCPVPLGFTISNLLPDNAAPVPVKFVGLSCAACHSQRIRTSDSKVDAVVVGAGTVSADIIALTDALKNAAAKLSAMKVTARMIQDAYEDKCGPEDSGFMSRVIDRAIERFFIDRWIVGFTAQTRAFATKYDMPVTGADLLRPEAIHAGPSRTRPFRSVVRNNLDFPGADNVAYSKVPAAFEQSLSLRPRSQYDGSIADPVTRSLIAAYTSGASLSALARPAITHNIRAAAEYTTNLGPSTGIKTFAAMFELPPADPVRLKSGRAAYMEHCANCHGYRPTSGGWWETAGARDIHKITPKDKLGTDAARVTFRYANLLSESLWVAFPGSPVPLAASSNPPSCKNQPLPAGYNAVEEQRGAIRSQAAEAIKKSDFSLADYWLGRRVGDFEQARRLFPAGHPLTFPRGDLCYDEDNLGYFNNPIPLVYLRAPYLHNGSVPTIEQLLNLKDRPQRFCRGDNAYDPGAMGLAASSPGESGCDNSTPFLFDAALPGNSNKGHDFPWKRDEVADNPEREQTIRDLIVYLRTQ